MIIIACDPGGTTGWAMYADGSVVFGQDEPMQFCARVDQILTERRPDQLDVMTEIVCERFTIFKKTAEKSQQQDAIEIIGVMRYFTLTRPTLAPLILQNPSDAKPLVTNDRLRAWGWWAKGQDHARDALRHLGYRMMQRGLVQLPPV